MTKSTLDLKKQEELLALKQALKTMTFNCNSIEPWESPDFIINGHIGVEITSYNRVLNGKSTIGEIESALDTVFSSYSSLYLNPYYTGSLTHVTLHDIVYSGKVNIKNVKNEIFEEIEYLRINRYKSISTKYVEDVSFVTIPNSSRNYVGLTRAAICDNIVLSDVCRIIDKKNMKLNDYKMLDRNQILDTYWLIVNFNAREYLDVRDVSQDVSLETSYDKILFHDIINTSQIYPSLEYNIPHF